MKKVIILVGIFIVVVVGVILFMIDQNYSRLSEAEIKEKFRCDRVSAEVLATDIYCQKPAYYHEDAANKAIIDPSDFDDPRYKALFEN